MSIQEIRQAIAELPPAQRAGLVQELLEAEGIEVETPLSFHDLAKGLIGPGSGISDLSSNPVHMEGYGEDSPA